MLQSNLVLVSTAALILGAGVVVGRLSYQLKPPQEQRSHNWLADQLKLTPDQRKQMDSIWANMQKQVEGAFGNRHALQKNHQQAVLNLFTPNQRAQYDKLDYDFHAQMDAQFKERETLMQDANKASRDLLDPDQQKKWDQLTAEMNSRRGSPGNGPGWGGPGGRMRGPGGRGGMDERGSDRRDRNGGNSGVGATSGGGAQNDSSTTRPSGGAQLN